MTVAVQVVVDCARPHHLAAWWAETLGWEVEPQDEAFIRRMVADGHATDADTTIHDGRLVWREACAITAGDASAPGTPRILFQQVPEPKTVKNRVHLDLRPEAGSDLEAIRRSLVDRGAVPLGSGRQGPHTWVVFRDPEGNEFCV